MAGKISDHFHTPILSYNIEIASNHSRVRSTDRIHKNPLFAGNSTASRLGFSFKNRHVLCSLSWLIHPGLLPLRYNVICALSLTVPMAIQWLEETSYGSETG